MDESRRGFWFGVAGYVGWGFFPLYWPLLKPAGALEILSDRIVFSLLVVLVLIGGLRRWPQLRAVLADRTRMGYLCVAAVVIAINWGVYIWGVNHNHVVETSLGYFINPLVTILLGVILLGERLRRMQWVALGIGVLAVVVLTVGYGRPPYIALILAFSFGTYGLMKKKANVGATESLAVETAVLFPLALVYLAVIEVHGTASFGHQGWGNALLLAGTGIVTATPLLLFAGAATRVSMTTLGLLQYFVPIIQFSIGLLVFHETMTNARWIGFGLVWVSLAVITLEQFTRLRPKPSTRQMTKPVEAPATLR